MIWAGSQGREALAAAPTGLSVQQEGVGDPPPALGQAGSLVPPSWDTLLSPASLGSGPALPSSSASLPPPLSLPRSTLGMESSAWVPLDKRSPLLCLMSPHILFHTRSLCQAAVWPWGALLKFCGTDPHLLKLEDTRAVPSTKLSVMMKMFYKSVLSICGLYN